MSLAEAFRRVARALDAAHIEYVVVGSTASAAWGVVRSTRDVDVVLVLPPGGAAAALAGLIADDLYVPVAEAAAALERGGSFNVLHPDSGGRVDVFVCLPDDEFERRRLARRVPMEVLGMPSFVATAEDVVLSKLRWRKDTKSEVQWRDCVEIAAAQPLDRAYMREWAATLQVADDLGLLLAQVDEALG
jgi:hypothetical protein